MTDSSTFKAPEIELAVADGPKMDPIRIQVDGPKTIGRSGDNDLTLSDPGVSRVHAAFDLSEGRVQIADRNSRSGVYLNMVRIDANQPEVLCNRDLISIGPWKFLVRLEEEEEEAPEPSLAQTDAPEQVQKEPRRPSTAGPHVRHAGKHISPPAGTRNH